MSQGRTSDSGTGPDAVERYIASLDDATLEDSRTLMDLMRNMSGSDPQLWNVGTIGFGSYHFRYASGREGDNHLLGFYPRAGKFTLYLMDGTARHAERLARIGKHTSSRVCVYFRRLADLDVTVLESVLRDSYAFLAANDGRVERVVD